MTLYVVERGSYSDRCVVGIFDTKAAAEEYGKALGDCDVSDYELNPTDPRVDLLRNGYQGWNISFDPEGNVFWVNNTDGMPHPDDQNSTHLGAMSRDSRSPTFLGISCNNIAAKGKDSAVKIASELRMRYMASDDYASTLAYYRKSYPNLK